MGSIIREESLLQKNELVHIFFITVTYMLEVYSFMVSYICRPDIDLLLKFLFVFVAQTCSVLLEIYELNGKMVRLKENRS